ncbi:MAG: sulfite exporter TauE/SafE family protein [Candidatus Aminicenantes bacterium]
MVENIFFLIASYLAAVGATVAGFGSSTLLIPVAVLFMDLKTAVFVVAVFHLFNNIFKIRIFWHKIEFRTFLLFGIPSILFAFGGAVLISALAVGVVKKVLASFLIVYSIYSLAKPKFGLKKSNLTAVVGGGLSGLLAGLIGLGGAIRSAFLVAFNLPKEIYVATSAMIAVVIDLTRIPTYLLTRTVEESSYYLLIPFLVGSAYLGVRTGKILLARIKQETFRRIVAGALFLVGIKILIW